MTDKRWSAVGFEDRDWVFAPGVAVPRRARIAGAGPYRASTVPRIAESARLQVGSETLTVVAEASNEIARFDTEFGSLLVPFSSVLLRSESAASSKIENLTANAQSILLAELGDPSKRNAAIIVANASAMSAALRLADRIDGNAILEMHRALMETSRPDWAGQWREQQVWIGGGDYSPHHADFVPPHHENVPAAVEDLVRFVQRENFPPLAQAAIAHAQFETIHPFPDGNGRVGRALVHAILKAKELTRNVTVPVSAGLLANLQQYFAALDTYRAGDHEPIVRLVAEASFRAISNGRMLARDLLDVRDQWRSEITARKDASVWELIDLVLRQPVLDSSIVQRELVIAPQNANNAIELLASIGALKQVSGNHRYRKWAAKDVLVALDRFAERSGRRALP